MDFYFDRMHQGGAWVRGVRGWEGRGGEAVRRVRWVRWWAGWGGWVGEAVRDEVKSDLNLTGQRWRVHIPKHFRPNRMTENPVTCGAYRSRTLLNSGEDQMQLCVHKGLGDWEDRKTSTSRIKLKAFLFFKGWHLIGLALTVMDNSTISQRPLAADPRAPLGMKHEGVIDQWKVLMNFISH